MKLSLPVRINADGLLPFMATLATPMGTTGEVELDFSKLQRVTPAGIVALVAAVTRWRKEGRIVRFTGLLECRITGYLQRMDVMRLCAIDIPEGFQRHDERGRFMPVQTIDHQVDELGRRISQCVAPGGDEYGHPLSALYDLIWYALTETANNVRQHSGGEGFASAQVGATEGMVRLAIADNGRGILESFRQAGLAWSLKADDRIAIGRALEPKVSSKGTPTNEGVGLTLLSGLARLTGAWLLIVSGTGWLRIGPAEPLFTDALPNSRRFPGTLIALTFRQKRVQDFALLLHQAKVEAGLLPRTGSPGMFRA